MAHIQLLTNTTVDEFRDKLGLDGNTWFFHVIFDTAYGHAIPTIQNLITSNVINAILSNEIYQTDQNNVENYIDDGKEGEEKINEKDFKYNIRDINNDKLN